MSLCVCVLTSPGEPDNARGALELLSACRPELDYDRLVHVHGLSGSEWREGYLADEELRLPAREDERGRCDRLNAGVQLAAASGCDYALLLESDTWPLRPRLMSVYVRRMVSRAGLLGAASLRRSGRSDAPAGGLWPRMLMLDLAWQRARHLFPLDWERYAEAVMLRSDQWEVPLLAGCVSASYFRRITESVASDSARETALSQLVRFEELEPVLIQGAEQEVWHAHLVVRGRSPVSRAELIRRAGAEIYGPTLKRLAEFDSAGWFNLAHAHPVSERSL